MGYLGSYQGDYLRSYRGDPGLFGFIGKTIKKVAGAAIGFTPAGRIAQHVYRAARGRPSPPRQQFPRTVTQRPGGMTTTTFPRGGRLETVGRFPGPEPGARRRRINPANPKALRRAIRRQAGFVKLAKRALKGTGYTIVSRGSRRTAKRISVRESGPGGVQIG